ncbi:LysR family transcriptional regulator [Kitasatospora sp. NPDC002543]
MLATDLPGHLRHFRAVAGKRHFGRAAERLRTARPSLAPRIQPLERELGTTCPTAPRAPPSRPNGDVVSETDPVVPC